MTLHIRAQCVEMLAFDSLGIASERRVVRSVGYRGWLTRKATS